VATITVVIGATNDDQSCAFLGSDYDPGGGYLNVGLYRSGVTSKKTIALRFINITIPAGSTITAAKVQMTGQSSSGTQSIGTVKAYIRAENVDSAAALPTVEATFKSRFTDGPLTTAVVDWNPLPTVVADTWYDTPDFSAVIQEIVSRGGWASGNNILVWIDDYDNRSTTNVGSERIFNSYAMASTRRPKIVISYTEGSPGKPLSLFKTLYLPEGAIR